MSETARPARANREGSPCPPWCETDHGAYDFHGGPRQKVAVRGKTRGQDGQAEVRPLQIGDEPVVSLTGMPYLSGGQPYPQAWISPRDAHGLAAIIGMLASATPAQHWDLAAAIVQAAGQITEAHDG